MRGKRLQLQPPTNGNAFQFARLYIRDTAAALQVTPLRQQLYLSFPQLVDMRQLTDGIRLGAQKNATDPDGQSRSVH